MGLGLGLGLGSGLGFGPPSWPWVSRPKPRSDPSSMRSNACSHPALRPATTPPLSVTVMGDSTVGTPRRRLPGWSKAGEMGGFGGG